MDFQILFFKLGLVFFTLIFLKLVAILYLERLLSFFEFEILLRALAVRKLVVNQKVVEQTLKNANEVKDRSFLEPLRIMQCVLSTRYRRGSRGGGGWIGWLATPYMTGLLKSCRLHLRIL